MADSYPKWAMSVRELREWGKYRGLRQKYGQFRLVISDGSQPLGEVTLRPHLLRYLQLQRAVVGRFKLFRSGTGEEIWLEAPYYRSLGAFMYHAPARHVDLASCAVGVTYYTDEQRKPIQEALVERGDTEEWLTAAEVQRPSLSSSRRSATPPFTSSKAVARGKLPTEQRLFPA